jgi:hypothetical protein
MLIVRKNYITLQGNINKILLFFIISISVIGTCLIIYYTLVGAVTPEVRQIILNNSDRIEDALNNNIRGVLPNNQRIREDNYST